MKEEFKEWLHGLKEPETWIQVFILFVAAVAMFLVLRG